MLFPCAQQDKTVELTKSQQEPDSGSPELHPHTAHQLPSQKLIAMLPQPPTPLVQQFHPDSPLLSSELLQNLSTDYCSEPNGKSSSNFDPQQYELLRKIGEGSFASVYLVQHRTAYNILALKKVGLFPAQIKFFGMCEYQKQSALNEALLLTVLAHPNIITLHSSYYDRTEDQLYLFLEYLKHGDLLQQIHSCVPFKECVIWRIVVDITCAMSYLHEHKLLHRDIKPANIFKTEQNTFKLSDFNISKFVKPGQMALSSIGTPYYMCPQIANGQPYDTKCDIWSLGVMIREVCCLEELRMTKSEKLIEDRVLIPEKYSYSLQRLVNLLLSKEPAMRPTAKEVLQYCEELGIRQMQVDNQEEEQPSKDKASKNQKQIGTETKIQAGGDDRILEVMESYKIPESSERYIDIKSTFKLYNSGLANGGSTKINSKVGSKREEEQSQPKGRNKNQMPVQNLNDDYYCNNDQKGSNFTNGDTVDRVKDSRTLSKKKIVKITSIKKLSPQVQRLQMRNIKGQQQQQQGLRTAQTSAKHTPKHTASCSPSKPQTLQVRPLVQRSNHFRLESFFSSSNSSIEKKNTGDISIYDSILLDE